ncbi:MULTISPECIES: PLP-dependent aminotransferase family protein [unclassified Clostridium]|uniref:aminotransferase-like domain-containing protein n=1 Tax=unclassified Clostridium TaxID=2614128 RepID=UPI0002974971|nr:MULTISPECIES: PLP-dependent aminotransferase family protein [unclassified Clostridium]EKQ53090.1 MAG: transcriptional regulator (HTH and aminotransferase domain containing protein) [Clostridium sp. Maddingley MBC34-26]
MPVNSFDNYPMTWKPNLTNKKGPLYKVLSDLLEEDIKNGVLKPGDKLPPQRELADFLDVNLSTISRTFKLCEQKGLISGEVGRGTYISSDVNVNSTLLNPSNTKNLIEMGATYPPYEQNKYVVKFIENMLHQANADKFLEYSSPCGTLAQRLSGMKWLKKLDLYVNEENILLSSGGQNSLCAILSSLFQSGDRIGTDPLIYSGVKTLAKMLGIQLIPIMQEMNEMSPIALKNYCKNNELKGIYLIPDHQNPTTHSMSLNTRKEIAEVAKEYNLIIIEDGINSMLSEAPIIPIAALAPEHTIYISSTSKVLCAGLRVSFMYTPHIYQKTLELALYNINMMVSPLNAEIVHQLINSPTGDKIIRERKNMIIERSNLTDIILDGFDILGDKYCNFRWLLLPEGWNGKIFETCAQNAGVQVYCAERFAIGNASVPAAVRISITAPKDLTELEKGLNIIKSILQHDNAFTML